MRYVDDFLHHRISFSITDHDRSFIEDQARLRDLRPTVLIRNLLLTIARLEVDVNPFSSGKCSPITVAFYKDHAEMVHQMIRESGVDRSKFLRSIIYWFRLHSETDLVDTPVRDNKSRKKTRKSALKKAQERYPEMFDKDGHLKSPSFHNS